MATTHDPPIPLLDATALHKRLFIFIPSFVDHPSSSMREDPLVVEREKKKKNNHNPRILMNTHPPRNSSTPSEHPQLQKKMIPLFLFDPGTTDVYETQTPTTISFKLRIAVLYLEDSMYVPLSTYPLFIFYLLDRFDSLPCPFLLPVHAQRISILFFEGCIVHNFLAIFGASRPL